VKGAILFFLLCAAALGDLAAGRRAFTNGDYAAALREFLPLAEQGDAVAQFRLGSMYHDGKGVTQDFKEAVRWYRLAAERGNASAQVNLGSMYHEGQGVTQNDKEAVRWYQVAAEQSDPEASAAAEFDLGVSYHRGIGVLKDDKEAIRRFRSAAEQAYPEGQAALGELYEEGRGVPQDYVQAYMWFNLAAVSGNADIIEKRDSIVTKMTPAQVAEAQRLARDWKPRASRHLTQLPNTMDWPQIIAAATLLLTAALAVFTWLMARRQLSMRWVRIREASIPKQERDMFERFGPTVIGSILYEGFSGRRTLTQPQQTVLYGGLESRENAAAWLY
jgi:hypothetical protein